MSLFSAALMTICTEIPLAAAKDRPFPVVAIGLSVLYVVCSCSSGEDLLIEYLPSIVGTAFLLGVPVHLAQRTHDRTATGPALPAPSHPKGSPCPCTSIPR